MIVTLVYIYVYTYMYVLLYHKIYQAICVCDRFRSTAQVEDSTADGVSTPASFEGSPWKYQQDVSILLLNLQEVWPAVVAFGISGHKDPNHADSTKATQYSYIYCFAEDDEDDGPRLIERNGQSGRTSSIQN